MKLNFYLGFLQFCFVLSQNTWSTIYALLPGLNGTDSWFMNNLHGGPISNCNGQDLFGGHGVFGATTFLSLNLQLPPHYSVRISLTLWKIDSWDAEIFQLIYDDNVYRNSFCGSGGKSYKELSVPLIFTIESHFSQSLVLIMTSNLNEDPYNESWGFRDFIIEILQCPEGCLFCQDYISDCKLWNNIASYWQNSINSEGWLIDNNQQLISSVCAGIQIAGGTNILQQGQSIKKLIQNVPKHFKIQIVLKLWVMGITQSQNFYLKIDEQVQIIVINALSVLNIECVYSQLVNIKNIVINADHSSPEIKLEMYTENNQSQSTYWGVKSFDLYVAQCSIGCEDCNGGLETQCSNCLKKWGFLDGICIPAPPLEYTNIRIYQSQGLKTNFINQFQLYIQQLDQTFTEIGQKKLIIDKRITFCSFLISVKCQEKIKIESFFRNCNQCDDAQIPFSNYCLNESNTVNFSVILADTVQSEKELIINISQTKVEILQVIIQNDIETEVRILKIEL
ncbi:unnamed protein product [Paramecium pentaurelia]|uniref:Uncharacterized protein n=1 Tax=Paramecium pentaurelia TaxID=43138 RepID=A0A8S1UKZ0_9CILI|nr:unnamed protein product [Paramecium pentaurelia]